MVISTNNCFLSPFRMGKNKFRLSHRKQSRKSSETSIDHVTVTDAFTQTEDYLSDDHTIDACTQTDISTDHGVMDSCTQTDISNDYGVMDDAYTQTEQEFEVTHVSSGIQTAEMSSLATLSMRKDHEQHLMSPVTESRIVRIPLHIFFDQKICSLSQLHGRLVSLKIMENWFLVASQPGSSIQMVRVNGQDVFTLEITDELKWFVHIASNCLPSISNIFHHLPSSVTSLQDIKSIVTYINTCSVCKGNRDPKFTPLVAKCKGVFKDRSGMYICSPVFIHISMHT